MKHLTQSLSVLVLLALLLQASPSWPDSGPEAGKRILVFFRFDDFSARSSTDLELKLITAFQQRGFSCTFAVVPFICERDYHDTARQAVMALPPEKAGILRQAMAAGTVEVALHGYSHQTLPKPAHSRYSEFSGLGYAEQEARIRAGRRFLEESVRSEVFTFVPPFNSYDLTTVRALVNLGFGCLSASRNGEAEEPSSLSYLPMTTELPGVRDAVEAAAAGTDNRPIVGVMFHEFDFIEVNKTRGTVTFEQFVRLLDWLAARKDIQVMTIREIADQANDAGPHRFLSNRRIDRIASFMPGIMAKGLGVYLEPDSAVRAWVRLVALAAGIHLVMLFVSAVLAYRLRCTAFSRLSPMHDAIIVTGSLSLFVAILNVMHFTDFTYRSGLLIAGLLGCCLGFSMAETRTEKREKRPAQSKTSGMTVEVKSDGHP